eukprot:1606334-Pleurochrysis_carterae.AAC.1
MPCAKGYAGACDHDEEERGHLSSGVRVCECACKICSRRRAAQAHSLQHARLPNSSTASM